MLCSVRKEANFIVFAFVSSTVILYDTSNNEEHLNNEWARPLGRNSGLSARARQQWRRARRAGTYFVEIFSAHGTPVFIFGTSKNITTRLNRKISSCTAMSVHPNAQLHTLDALQWGELKRHIKFSFKKLNKRSTKKEKWNRWNHAISATVLPTARPFAAQCTALHWAS